MERFEWTFTVNAYITPRGAQGFFPHTDYQDVFVLQLDGTKEWTVYHRPVVAAVGETAILLHPPLNLLGVLIGINRGVSSK